VLKGSNSRRSAYITSGTAPTGMAKCNGMGKYVVIVVQTLPITSDTVTSAKKRFVIEFGTNNDITCSENLDSVYTMSPTEGA
jgi:hypothetical protein